MFCKYNSKWFNFYQYKMTQYDRLNVKLSNSQTQTKSAIKNETEVDLRLSSNMVGNFDDETNFPQDLLLTDRQVSNLRKEFASYLSTDFKLSKFNYLRWYSQEDFLVEFLVHY